METKLNPRGGNPEKGHLILTFYPSNEKRFSPLDVHSAAEEIGGHENTLLEILKLLIPREKTQCYTHGCTKLEFQISKIYL
jgi:hypothetical protein